MCAEISPAVNPLADNEIPGWNAVRHRARRSAMALAVGARMLAKIDDRFALLTTGDPTAAPYHRSLDALVRWRAMTCALPRNGYSGRE